MTDRITLFGRMMNLIPSRCWACNAATSEIVGTKSQVERRRDSFPGIRSLPCPPTFIFGRIVSLDDYFILYIYFFFLDGTKNPNQDKPFRMDPIIPNFMLGKDGKWSQDPEQRKSRKDP